MGRLRRFVLVATASTGFLLWVAQPFELRRERAIPILGLIIGILSAGVPWAPRIADTRLGRIVLGGWISFGVLAMLALASRDLQGVSFAARDQIWLWIVLWLVGTGVVGQLAIRDCRPSDIYFGMGLMWMSASPWLHAGDFGKLVVGLAVLGLVPFVCAHITLAIQRRIVGEARPDLPDARAL